MVNRRNLDRYILSLPFQLQSVILQNSCLLTRASLVQWHCCVFPHDCTPSANPVVVSTPRRLTLSLKCIDVSLDAIHVVLYFEKLFTLSNPYVLRPDSSQVFHVDLVKLRVKMLAPILVNLWLCQEYWMCVIADAVYCLNELPVWIHIDWRLDRIDGSLQVPHPHLSFLSCFSSQW